MSSKLFSRSGVFAWSPRGVDLKGLIVADFAQFYDPNAGSFEPTIDFLSKNRLYQEPVLSSDASAKTNFRFNELAWSSMSSDAHPSGIVGGGTEDGTVVFFDAHKFLKDKKFEVLSARKDHHGHVLTIDVSKDGRWMASGGGSGQILLWDVSNLKTPFSPGAPNFPDQVKMLRWNQRNESVFASVSSRRVSFWDVRRNGAPVLEFAELPSCDWSSLCWHPSDASQLIVGSQSHQCPVVQKWDSRFTSTPIKEYHLHPNGVTSVDWNKSDDRLLISSGCDGQVLIWNHETAQMLGGVGSLKNDWIRSVRWNEEEPSQFAIQYYQHPIQISSLTALGNPQPEAEVLAPRITDDFVPAWHRAPLIGSSLSLGGRLATFWKNYDPITQTVTHSVEVETIAQTENIGAQEVAQFLHIKDDKRNLGWFLHERAFTTPTISHSPDDIELERTIWRILLGLQEKGGRTKMLQCLGIVDDNEETFSTDVTSNMATSATSATSNTQTTRSVRSTSVISNVTSEGDVPEIPIVEKCAEVKWNQLDSSGWDLVLHSLRQNHLEVIRILIASHQHVAAMMYAAQHDTEHLSMILEDFNRVTSNSNPLSSLMLAISTSSTGHHHHQNSLNLQDVQLKIDELLRTYPDSKWKELLGLIVARENSTEQIELAANHLGMRWLESGKPLRACIAFLIGGNVDGLLNANKMFSSSDRMIQALVLHQISKKPNYSKELEEFTITYTHHLLSHGASSTAWNLIKCAQNANSEILELQWTCWNVAGGRECTGDPAPFNPYGEVAKVGQRKVQNTNQMGYYHQQQPGYQQGPNQIYQQQPFNSYNQSQAPPTQHPPMNGYENGYQTPNLPPMPPSSTFYPTPSWDHKPPPTMPANMPPPKPSAPMTPGWNDPPPGMITARKTPPTQPKTNVMEFTWKTTDMPPAPGGMMAPQQPNYGGGAQQIMNGVQGMTIAPSSAASSSFPSPASTQAPPTIQLSAEDEKIVEPINHLAQQIIETARVQARIEKATELRARIQAELVPRLAAQRLTPATKHHLTNMAYFLSANQVREAQSVVSQMARNATDFVEISSFLPALKSLFSLATH